MEKENALRKPNSFQTYLVYIPNLSSSVRLLHKYMQVITSRSYVNI